ncbi:MAG: hypothetical protein WBI82_12810 [Sphaerochaeta sp.]
MKQMHNIPKRWKYLKLKNFDSADMKSIYTGCNNGYKKLQVCRLIEHEEKDAVIEKFIKQTYHIENEFICQLDPTKFDTIPEYIVVDCDKIVGDTL